MVTMMMLLPGEHNTELPYVAAGSGKAGLLLSKDLIFMTKIKRTAAELGYSVLIAGIDSQAVSMIETYRPSVVLIDLSAGGLVAPEALMTYQQMAGSGTWFVAFGSHVNVESLNSAKAAGCHVVLARSRFAAQLPDLLRRYFTQPASHESHGQVGAE